MIVFQRGIGDKNHIDTIFAFCDSVRCRGGRGGSSGHLVTLNFVLTPTLSEDSRGFLFCFSNVMNILQLDSDGEFLIFINNLFRVNGLKFENPTALGLRKILFFA